MPINAISILVLYIHILLSALCLLLTFAKQPFRWKCSRRKHNMGRAPCCDKANVKRGPWSPDEDIRLKEFIEKYGTGGNWIALPQKAGLKRCGKSCRLRWLNYLRPSIKHGHFSDYEDRVICALFATIGSRWSIIAAQLPGRTDNDIKNYWNTKLKKKLLGISPAQTRTNHQLVHSNIYNDPNLVSPLLNNDSFQTTFSQESLVNYSLPLSDYASSFCQDQYLVSNHHNNIDANITAQSCSSSEISSYGKDLEYFESYLNNGVEENQHQIKNMLEYDYEDVNKLIGVPANYVEGFNSVCPTDQYYI